MRYIVGVLILCVVASISQMVHAEECPAASAWFAAAGTPRPSVAEPKRGDDCQFYQRAWQQFLYATQQVKGVPRFLSYKTYADVFGADRKAGLMAAHGKLMSLAPRTMESAQVADAEDIDQAGSNTVLIDQSGHPIFYNIILNPEFAQFIVDNHLNSWPALKNFDPEKEIPVGAVEYKAAWQVVDPDHSPTDRIVTRAQVPILMADPMHPGKIVVARPHDTRDVTVALIGLHVVFRPIGHPEMIWATFEYDRNAPSTNGNPPNAGAANPASACANSGELQGNTALDDGKPYLLYKNGTTGTALSVKPSSLTVVDSGLQTFQAAPNTTIARVFPFSGCFPGFNPDHAITQVDGAVVAVNASAKPQIRDASRKSYSLEGAVWLDEPRNPNTDLAFKAKANFDDFQLGGEDRLSSTSMESFTQIAAPNCFTCHQTEEKGNLGGMRINVSHIFRRFSLDKPK